MSLIFDACYLLVVGAPLMVWWTAVGSTKMCVQARMLKGQRAQIRERIRRFQEFLDQEKRKEFMKKFRSEEHTSELQSLMRISYAVFCLQKKNTKNKYANKYINIHRE